MTNGSTATSCKLSAPNGTVFNSKPGDVSLTLKQINGSVTFSLQNTDVLDSSGKSVNPTKTLTTLSFKVTAGQTYVLETVYHIVPLSADATLQEDCTNGVELSQVSVLTPTQQFTIRG